MPRKTKVREWQLHMWLMEKTYIFNRNRWEEEEKYQLEYFAVFIINSYELRWNCENIQSFALHYDLLDQRI